MNYMVVLKKCMKCMKIEFDDPTKNIGDEITNKKFSPICHISKEKFQIYIKI